MGLIQRSMRSRDPWDPWDPWDPEIHEIQSKKLINDHTRGKSYTICEEKNLSANAMERDQWSIIRLKTWTNHLPVADSVRRIEICMGRSRVEHLQHVEGRPDVSEWEGSQNNQAKLHFLKGDNLTKYESSARLFESARRESLKVQAQPSQFRGRISPLKEVRSLEDPVKVNLLKERWLRGMKLRGWPEIGSSQCEDQDQDIVLLHLNSRLKWRWSKLNMYLRRLWYQYWIIVQATWEPEDHSNKVTILYLQ